MIEIEGLGPAARRPAAPSRQRRVLETVGVGARHRTPERPRPRTVQTRRRARRIRQSQRSILPLPRLQPPRHSLRPRSLVRGGAKSTPIKADARPQPISPPNADATTAARHWASTQTRGDANGTITWTDQHGHYKQPPNPTTTTTASDPSSPRDSVASTSAACPKRWMTGRYLMGAGLGRRGKCTSSHESPA